jgi:hypothetical protein
MFANHGSSFNQENQGSDKSTKIRKGTPFKLVNAPTPPAARERQPHSVAQTRA